VYVNLIKLKCLLLHLVYHHYYDHYFPGVKCGWGVLLTTHPLLVLRSWKSRAIPLPTLWVTPGLSQEHFTFTFTMTSMISLLHFGSNVTVTPSVTASARQLWQFQKIKKYKLRLAYKCIKYITNSYIYIYTYTKINTHLAILELKDTDRQT